MPLNTAGFHLNQTPFCFELNGSDGSFHLAPPEQSNPSFQSSEGRDNIFRKPRGPHSIWSSFRRKPLIMAFGLLFASLRFAAPDQVYADEHSATVMGTITDQRGDLVPGASVAITQPAAPTRTVVTDPSGTFSVQADAGSFDLQISMSGFSTRVIHVKVNDMEKLDLGTVVLQLEGVTADVIVTVAQQELAREQIKVEEGQRIFGVIPNFLVAYDRNAVPLNSKQKFQLAFKSMIDPETIGADLAISGLQQKTGSFKAYGTGPAGYAKRMASSYGTSSMDAMLGSALLPSLFKQDPRYFYKGSGSIKQRSLYAISMAVVCKGDNGHWQYNYSGLLGGLAVGGITNLYYPSADRRGLNQTFENIAIGTGSTALSNLVQEFLLKRLTHHPKQ
jgi:hypothetical protein